MSITKLISDAKEIAALNVVDQSNKRLQWELHRAATQLEQLNGNISSETVAMINNLTEQVRRIDKGFPVSNLGIVRDDCIDRLCSQQAAAVERVQFLMEVLTDTHGQ